MTNVTELTAKLKAAALKAKSATEDYAAGRISITTCYSECAEFNSLTDGPDQILPLTEALEAAEKRIADLTVALEADMKSADERYENRTPTEWAYNQACAAIEKHRLRADTAEELCAEAYQVIGSLAECAGMFETRAVEKALDNLSHLKMVHDDVLPFPVSARTLTVKLPDVEKWRSVDAVRAQSAYKILASKDIAEAFERAGIKLQIEGDLLCPIQP